MSTCTMKIAQCYLSIRGGAWEERLRKSRKSGYSFKEKLNHTRPQNHLKEYGLS